MKTILLALLSKLTDSALADSVVGDLEEKRDHRGRAWFVMAAFGIVVHLLGQRLSSLVRSATSACRGSGLAGELRQSARSLIRTPVVTIVVVLTLALGFGLNTAIFSVVHSVLFEPLPFDRAEELVVVRGTRRGQPPQLFGTSYPDYRDLLATQTSLRDLALCTYWTFTLTGTDVPHRLLGQRVSGSFFPLLGMPPLIGRWIEASDDTAGGPEVVVLSHRLWRRLFAGDRDVVGRDLQINGQTARVIGVMPEAFRFPFDDVELWAPALDELDTIPRNSRFLTTLGRLRPGVRIADAEGELLRLATALEAAYPATNRDWRPSLAAAVPALTGDARPRLLLLLWGVVVVLLVACVNVTTLIVARAAARRREFVLRQMLGATRARLIRLTLLESAWLGAAGLVAGWVVAVPAIAALRALAPDSLPRLSNIGPHWTVFTYAAVAMVMFVVGSALAPWASRRASPRQLRPRAATVTAFARGWGRRTLVICQVGGAFALLVGAGLLVRSFARVVAVDPGFDPTNVATVRVFLTPPTYRSIESQIDYISRAIERLRHTPGIISASAVSQPPFDTESAGSTLATAVEGRAYAPGSHPLATYRAADAAYFQTVGLRLLEGRGFNGDDRRGSPLVAVINQSMARTFWPSESPLGLRFEFADGRRAGWFTVIGVVNDVATDGLEAAERPAVYAPFVQRTLPFMRWMTLVVRTEGDVAAQLPAIRARLQALDTNQPLYAIAPMSQTIAASMAERRFSLMLMLAFAVLTLTLSALGLYGTLAQRVSQRSRELGVRLALGARPRQVSRLVMTEGAALVGVGIAVGAVVAAAGAPLIRDSLFGVSATDAATYAAIVVVLGITTLIATFVPSRTAARTDPVRVLKSD